MSNIGNFFDKILFIVHWMKDDMNDSSTRCQNYAEVACFSCGTEYCFAKVAGRYSNSFISHASAAHQPQWFHLTGPKALCLKK